MTADTISVTYPVSISNVTELEMTQVKESTRRHVQLCSSIISSLQRPHSKRDVDVALTTHFIVHNGSYVTKHTKIEDEDILYVKLAATNEMTAAIGSAKIDDSISASLNITNPARLCAAADGLSQILFDTAPVTPTPAVPEAANASATLASCTAASSLAAANPTGFETDFSFWKVLGECCYDCSPAEPCGDASFSDVTDAASDPSDPLHHCLSYATAGCVLLYQ